MRSFECAFCFSFFSFSKIHKCLFRFFFLIVERVKSLQGDSIDIDMVHLCVLVCTIAFWTVSFNAIAKMLAENSISIKYFIAIYCHLCMCSYFGFLGHSLSLSQTHLRRFDLIHFQYYGDTHKIDNKLFMIANSNDNRPNMFENKKYFASSLYLSLDSGSRSLCLLSYGEAYIWKYEEEKKYYR